MAIEWELSVMGTANVLTPAMLNGEESLFSPQLVNVLRILYVFPEHLPK